MKKLGKIITIVAIFVMMLVLAGATLAFTASPNVSLDNVSLDTVSIPETVERVAADITEVADGNGARRGAPDGRRGILNDSETVKEAIADALGISVEELDTALEEGIKVSDLAEELGVDMAIVEEAIYNATITEINAAVEAGELTQEEADAMLARVELRRLSNEIFSKEDAAAVTAGVLGITVEELEEAKENDTYGDLLEEGDREAIRSAVQAAREQAINDAVADGTITQEQADQLLEEGGCSGKHGGRGGRRGGNRGGGDGEAPTIPQGDNA